MTRLALLLSAAAALAACTDPTTAPAIDDGGAGGKAEEWGSGDDPDGFGTGMVYEASALPRTGAAAQTPWAGHYWPTAEDSINNRWNGATTDSPAAKYGKAFGVTGVEDAVSATFGIDGRDGAACTDDSACDLDAGEMCAIRRGATEGKCLPTWEGICHAWAPAAIMLAEPKHAATYNGVTFKVQDVKALVSIMYDDTSSKSVSLRCEADESTIPVDSNGRPTARACKDTNAGTWHLIATNYLGLKQKAFVYDRTWDDEVWNQPVRSYSITRYEPITAAAANKLITGATTGSTTYAYNRDAASLVRVHMDLKYIAESPASKDGNLAATISRYTRTDKLDYVLELDAAGKVIGGEWFGASKTDHPDFLWLPTRRNGASVAKGKITWTNVKKIYALSVE